MKENTQKNNLEIGLISTELFTKEYCENSKLEEKQAKSRERFNQWTKIIKKENNYKNDSDLADALGYSSKSQISQFRNGQRPINEGLINRMLEITQYGYERYSIDYFLGLSDITGEREKERINYVNLKKRIRLLSALYGYYNIELDKDDLNNLYSNNDTIDTISLYDSQTHESKGYLHDYGMTRINHTLDIITDIFEHYLL